MNTYSIQNTDNILQSNEGVISISAKELSYALIEALYIGRFSACKNISSIAMQLREASTQFDNVDDAANGEEFSRGYLDAIGFMSSYCADYNDRPMSNAHEAAEFLIRELEDGAFSETGLQ